MQTLWSAVIGTTLRVNFLHINSYAICFVISKPSRWQEVQGFLTSVLFPANNFKVTIYKFTSTTLLVKMILYSKGIKMYGLRFSTSISDFLKHTLFFLILGLSHTCSCFPVLCRTLKNSQGKIKCWFVSTEITQYPIKYIWNRTTTNPTTQLKKKSLLYIHNSHSENTEITFCLYQSALKTFFGFFIKSSHLALRYNINKLKTQCCIFISCTHCSHIQKQVRVLVFTFSFLPRLRKH